MRLFGIGEEARYTGAEDVVIVPTGRLAYGEANPVLLSSHSPMMSILR